MAGNVTVVPNTIVMLLFSKTAGRIEHTIISILNCLIFEF